MLDTAVAPAFQPLTELQKLSHVHLRMVELALSGTLNKKEIAAALDIHPQTVVMVMKSPLFQEQLAKRRQTQQRTTDSTVALSTHRAEQIIADAQNDAAETVRELLTSVDERTKLAAAKDILDRSGIGQQRDGAMPNIQLSADKMQILIVALQEEQLLNSKSLQQNTAV